VQSAEPFRFIITSASGGTGRQRARTRTVGHIDIKDGRCTGGLPRICEPERMRNSSWCSQTNGRAMIASHSRRRPAGVASGSRATKKPVSA